jgi:hypothetical protein
MVRPWNEFYRVAFHKNIYRAIDELRVDLDTWLVECNQRRPHQGSWCFGKTPMQTFLVTRCPWRRRKLWLLDGSASLNAATRRRGAELADRGFEMRR